MRQQSEYLEKLYSNFKDSNDPLQARFSLDCAFPLPETYPHIFSSCVNQDGFITQQTSVEPAQSVPVFTQFESGSILKETVDHHLNNLNKIAFNDFYEYSQGESGLSREDFLETKEALISLSDNYRNDDDSMML
jgi:hypothetical protein